MGAEQASGTMEIVARAGAARKGVEPDEDALAAQTARITEIFESQMDVFHTSARLLDDGVIDPRDTRAVLALALRICAEGDARAPRPVQFAVARP